MMHIRKVVAILGERGIKAFGQVYKGVFVFILFQIKYYKQSSWTQN